MLKRNPAFLNFALLLALLSAAGWLPGRRLAHSTRILAVRNEPHETPLFRAYQFHDDVIESVVEKAVPHWSETLVQTGAVRLPRLKAIAADLSRAYEEKAAGSGLSERERLHRAMLDIQMGRWAAGCKKYEALLEIDLNRLWPIERTRFGQDIVNFCAKGDAENAWAASFRKLSESETRSSRNGLYLLGKLALRHGHKKKALQLFEAAAEGGNPLIEALMEQSRIWLAESKREFEPAIRLSYEAAEKAYRANPYDFHAWIMMADRLIWTSRGDEALALLDQYLANYRADQPEILQERAMTNISLARYDEAFADFQRCLDVAPGWESCHIERIRLSGAIRKVGRLPGQMAAFLAADSDWAGGIGDVLYWNRFLVPLVLLAALVYFYAGRMNKGAGAGLTLLGLLAAWQAISACGGEAAAPFYLGAAANNALTKSLLWGGALPLAALLVVGWWIGWQAPGKKPLPDLSAWLGPKKLFALLAAGLAVWTLAVAAGLGFQNQFPDAVRYIQGGLAPVELGVKGYVRHMVHTQGSGIALTIAPFLWTALFIPLSALIGKAAAIAALNWLAPMLWHLLALWACHRFVEEWIDRKTAALSALLLFGCPMFLFFGYFYLTDVPLAAMTLLTCWAFVAANKRDSVALGLAAAALALAACGVKMIGAAVWPILLGLYPTLDRKSLRATASVFAVPAALGACGLIAAALMPGGAKILAGLSGYAGKIFMSAISAFIDPSNSETNIAHPDHSPLLFLKLVHGVIGFPVVLFMAAVAFPALKGPASGPPFPSRPGMKAKTAFLFLCPALIVAFFSFTQARILRYALFVFPFFCILAAVGLRKLEERFESGGATAIALAAACLMALSALCCFQTGAMSALTIRLPDF